jgi:hypothetical protein
MIYTANLTAGELPVAVEYELTPGEAQTRDDPGYPAELSIVAVIAGGVRIELPDDVFCSSLLARWEGEILEEHDDNNEPDPDAGRDRQMDDRMLERECSFSLA